MTVAMSVIAEEGLMFNDHNRPNLLIIMSDEHAPQFSGAYGHPLVQSPHLDRLAAEGVLCENAYCNTPLCTSSRMSFMTGRYISNIETWDNTASLRVDAPTWAHRLRAVGYDVVLSGKQHFIGPDQLHGFRAQLARDLHAETPLEHYEWADGTPAAPAPWHHLDLAGPGRSTEIEVDDQVEEAAIRYVRDPERKNRPWALNASFIAPHFPFIVPQQYWDLYPPEAVDLPRSRPGSIAEQHPVYQRMRGMFGLVDFSEEQVRRARAGYYGLITYLDDKIGRLLQALEETGQRENTLVIYISDHGEMAGEHGMWRKSNFLEYSSRIPVILSWPGRLPAGRRMAEVVSLVDVVAGMLEAAGAPMDESLDGDSLLPLARGDEGAAETWKDEAFAEYLAHGVTGPMAMLRRGRYKLNYSLGDPPELFDLESDPEEMQDLAHDLDYRQVRDELIERLLSRWDPVSLDRRVRQSQKERRLIEQALVHA
jgi:choline-sulfatase